MANSKTASPLKIALDALKDDKARVKFLMNCLAQSTSATEQICALTYNNSLQLRFLIECKEKEGGAKYEAWKKDFEKRIIDSAPPKAKGGLAQA